MFAMVIAVAGCSVSPQLIFITRFLPVGVSWCVCETKINSAYGHNKTTSILYREVSSVKGFKLKLSALVDECVVKTWMSV